MDIKIGSLVTRKSYNNDLVFKVLSITDDNVYLKGVYERLCADSPIEDLIIVNNTQDDFIVNLDFNGNRNSYFYLPGKILHIDGDEEYLNTCLKFYKKMKVHAVGKKLIEKDIPSQLTILLNETRPDVLVITGHDSYNKMAKNELDINNYKNSKYFVKAVKIARKYEKNHEKLIIIAGACQSDYEELIKAGANFASSPKRVNIHALDPAIIAVSIALTETNKQIDLVNILNKTKYGSDGMGGIITSGLMYVGYPR